MNHRTWSTLRERAHSPSAEGRRPARTPEARRGRSSHHSLAAGGESGVRGRHCFGRYVMHRELAVGSMFRVYQAEDPLAKRLVAIKTLRWECVSPETAGYFLARLDRQAQTAGRLCHPHLIKVFDRGSDFLVLELLQGLKLSTVLRERGRLDVDQALRLLAPLASAVDHMHSRGVIHRDIKPANVIVLADGSPKLIDFGSSCLAGEAIERWDRWLGTPAHMAPEQALHGTANALTDLFSFGVLAYEVLTGQPPFRSDSLGAIASLVVHDEAPPPSHWVTELPRPYDEAFARVLARDHSARPTSAGAFVRALQNARRRRDARTDEETALRDEQARDLARLQQSLPARGLDACVVEVRSEPEGADVWWNGLLQGATPVRICETGPGPHTLRLLRDGCAPVEAVFMLPEAPSLRLQFTLAPGAGRVLEFRR